PRRRPRLLLLLVLVLLRLVGIEWLSLLNNDTSHDCVCVCVCVLLVEAARGNVFIRKQEVAVWPVDRSNQREPPATGNVGQAFFLVSSPPEEQEQQMKMYE